MFSLLLSALLTLGTPQTPLPPAGAQRESEIARLTRLVRRVRDQSINQRDPLILSLEERINWLKRNR